MCNGICRIINGVSLNNKLYMARWANLHIENMFCQIWKGLDLLKDGIYSSQTGLILNQQKNNLQER